MLHHDQPEALARVLRGFPRRALNGKSSVRKFRLIEHTDCAMDIERINDIGNLLADLTARTDALRGYL